MSTHNHSANTATTTTSTMCPLAGFFGSVVGQIGTMIHGR